MAFFKITAVALTVVAMACTAATAQAQSGKRIVVAMVPADVSPELEARPARAPAPVVAAPRAKRVATVAAPMIARAPDCFWCNAKMTVTGLSM